MQIVCVSGNTGAGKSTLLSSLADGIANIGLRAETMDERSLHHPMLQRLFDEPSRWGLAMQLNFLIQRAAAILSHAEGPVEVLVMERSQSEDPIFFERLVRLGHVDAALLGSYEAMHRALSDKCPRPRGYVFLQVRPDVCVARLNAAMLDGSRPVEVTGEALRKYVDELDAAYSGWRMSLPADTGVFDLQVNGSSGPAKADIEECVDVVAGWLDR
jgi:deoxyadenosine/deoxycytidine kinase